MTSQATSREQQIDTKKSLEIVISRFNEDISWIEKVSNKFPEIKISLYNKGAPLNVDNEIILSKNAGRESSTFFYHIIENYHNLSDITIFCQGHPWDHCEDIVERSHAAIVGKPLKSLMGYQWHDNAPWPCPATISSLPFVILRPQHTVERRSDSWKNGHRAKTWYGKPTSNKYDKAWRILFQGDRCPNELSVFNCQFIVCKERITYRSIDFYNKAYSIVNKHKSSQEAWLYERFWDIIFDGTTRDNFPKSIDKK